MNPNAIIRHAAKLSSHASVNLFQSLIPPKVVKQEAAPFASALAHEVRNPLTNINLAVEMLRTTLKSDEEKVYLDIILRGSDRINALVTDLLTTCQNEDPQLEIYSIHDLLEDVLATNKDRIVLKHITVRKDYTVPDRKILVDKEKMKIALTNIVVNAIDAMSPVNGTLRLITRSMHGKPILEIADNGSGISEANMKNIFKPYFTSKPDGMGLGLSTTRNILLSNEVRMEVRSQEGKGTRFVLCFDKTPQSVSAIIRKPEAEISHRKPDPEMAYRKPAPEMADREPAPEMA